MEVNYNFNEKKPVDKEWVEEQFKNFWEQVKSYIDNNNNLHIKNQKLVFTTNDKDIEIATIPQN